MRLRIVVQVKTRHDRPSFTVYNYGILTYDSCKRKMWLDFAVVLEYRGTRPPTPPTFWTEIRANVCPLLQLVTYWNAV